MKKQIGCCFVVDGHEFIYEGSYPRSSSVFICNLCSKPINGRIHVFFSSSGYHDGSHTTQYYSGTCVKVIIQAGYKKSV